jgi:isopenicillin N synthase-like dioxygenase
MISFTMGSKLVQTTSNNSVPVVDLSAFTEHRDLESRRRAAQELALKGHANGCVGIMGHGMPRDMLEQIFAMTKKLFDLPYEEKMKAPLPESRTPHRGYLGIGRERAAATPLDEKSTELERENHAKSIVTDFKVCTHRCLEESP